jgi:uncharacterized protein YyaL (SSP411 family)
MVTATVLLGSMLAAGSVAWAEPAAKAGAKPPTNRLAKESSPYLLLHAHNPVDWYPWGPEAFEKARRENKPIFLSIGYSTCHWCHVMERKSFSNPEIARTMNEHFVNVKVDREERPDIDDVYMTALHIYFQAIGSPQGGGWPLSMFLTPQGKPLGGGTYFPPDDEDGRIGFNTLMTRVHEMWRDKQKDMEANADLLAKAVQTSLRPKLALQATKLDASLLTGVTAQLGEMFDRDHGGFGFSASNSNRPKFPVPVRLNLLLHLAEQDRDEAALAMVTQTLDRMAAGGIHDQLGGGFHRYSTDRFWRVPHFEKMLYDNAQLADVYVQAFRQTKKPAYRDVAERLFDFVLRDLTDPDGGFYSALDADTDGVEGKLYLWKLSDIEPLLSAGEVELARRAFGLDREADFPEGNVLTLAASLEQLAEQTQSTAADVAQRLQTIRIKLLTARQKRPAVLRDDKIQTGWNGLMIGALARGGSLLKEPRYVKAADKAALFVLAKLRNEQGRLLHSVCKSRTSGAAYVDDYAFLVDGLLALHAATKDDKWLNAARRLTDQQLALFWDEKGKGCYFTANDTEELLARGKSASDSVLPSGNSVSARNLLRLASVTGEATYRDRARETLEAFASQLRESPASQANLALALSEFLAGATPAAATKPVKGASTGGPVGSDIPEKSVVSQASGEKSSPSGKKKLPELVTGEVLFNVDRLPATGKCKVLIRLKIENGWHINTNPAQPDYLVPTVVTMKSKLGSKLGAVKYPAGKKIKLEGIDEPMTAYENQVSFTADLEVSVDATGKQEELTFEAKYQACNDDQCLRPTTLKLVVPIAVARPGEAVKPANEKAFAGDGKKK